MRSVFRIVNLILMVGLLFLVCSFSGPKPVLAYVDDDTVFINEIHYANAGDDIDEQVEIAGPSGTSLTGWQLVVYDGSTGLAGVTVTLTQTIPETSSGYGMIVVEIAELFDGGPGGLALVKPGGSAAMFLSVGGSFTASDGPAIGLTSTDLGVAELGTDAPGFSLQLDGLGTTYSDFTWQPAAEDTFGGVNTNQFFGEIFINEIHYMNNGPDVNEGIELAGPAGLSLAGWKILIYQASTQSVRSTEILTGTFPDQQNGFGTLNFLFESLNDNREGFALVDQSNQLVQFLSYNGRVYANTGAAAGQWSVNISDAPGAVEIAQTPIDHSLQLAGQGVEYSDFTWQPPAVHTRGAVNNNQTLGFDVNTAPVAADQAVSTNEDTPLSITLSAVDENDDPLTYHLDQDVQHGTLTTDTTSAWSYTPDLNFFGSDSFTFYANDSTVNGNSATVTITVEAVNDAPSFTPGENSIINEDAGDQTVSAWATEITAGAENEIDQILTFDLSITSGNDLFSTAPAIDPASGDLTFTPAADKNGTAVIDVVLRDDGGMEHDGVNSSAAHSLTIQINPVNDAPYFTPGEDVTVNEDPGDQTVPAWAAGINPGPSDESAQSLTFDVQCTSGSDLFSAPPTIDQASGDLTFTAAADKNGIAEIEVTLSDDGGTLHGGVDTSSVHTLTIQINPVNDAPSFTPGENVTVNEDAPTQTVSAWAAGINPGPPDESAQSLTFDLQCTSGSDLFNAPPAIDPASGDLTFTLAADKNGIAEIEVTLSDDGGTLHGGIDTSSVHTLTIQINPVNDQPSFTAGEDITVLEDAGVQIISGWATGMDAGAADETNQALSFNLTVTTGSELFSTAPAINPETGDLTFTPAENQFGVAAISVSLSDNGGTLYGGVDTSSVYMRQITIYPVNDKPSFTAGEDITVLEDSGAYAETNWATNICTGPDNEAEQTIQFNLNIGQPDLFETQPFLQADGTLTFTPAADAFGTTIVAVVLTDDGGTANGGEDTSTEHSFVITVEADDDNHSYHIYLPLLVR